MSLLEKFETIWTFGSTAAEVADLLVDAGYRVLATPQLAKQYHLPAFAG